VAVASAVRRPSPLHWLHRLGRPSGPRHPVVPCVAPPPASYAANMDRWAVLPGEYDAAPAPIRAARVAMAEPGVSATIPCTPGGPTVLHLGGAWRGQVVFEGSANGRTWQPVPLLPLNGDIAVAATRPGVWRTTPDTASRFVRVRVVALTAGSLSITAAGVASGAMVAIPEKAAA
jgi:hypothetical protein